jgi:glyoxylase-like metal-dependent hydrolase (beta-lactamase superfamily II)
LDSELQNERRKRMNAETFHFNVGTFECFAVSDGFGIYSNPARILFADAPQESLPQVLHEHNINPEEWTEWVSPFICLLIRTDKHLVLVDTGYGIVDFAQNAGKLVQNLQTVGITPQDIDTVILTHGHRDHLYGVTDDATGKVVFSNARHVMWRGEWDFRNSAEGLDLDDGDASRKLSAIEGRLDLIDSEIEIVPGIHAIHAPGHTPGHMALAIVSDGEQLLDLVDAVGHPIHLEQPHWNMRTDYQPELAERSRRMLLSRAAAEHASILAYHFDFPGLGYVEQQQDEWKWQPIVATTDREGL